MEIDICPRWLLRVFRVPETLATHAGIFLSSLLILLAAPIATHVPHLCLAQTLFNLPCPGCGITHSLIDTLHLDIHSAWKANPAGIVFCLYLVIQACGRLVVIILGRGGGLMSRLSSVGEKPVFAAIFGVWLVRLFNG